MALDDDCYFADTLPLALPEHWREWIGSLELRELERCSTFLLVTGPAEQHLPYDTHAEELKRRLLYFYLGVLVAVPYLSFEQPIFLAGDYEDGEVAVRTKTRYHRTWNTVGSPESELTKGKLHEGARFGRAVWDLGENRRSDRVRRIVGAFRKGCEASHLDDRLHEFVRAAEGCLNSENNRQFADRAQQVTDGDFRAMYKEMYIIRSSTEHMRGPTARINASTEATAKRVLIQRTIQAETLARFLLWNFLGNESLGSYFASDDDIDRLWNLPGKQRAQLWATKVSMAHATRDFAERLNIHGYRDSG